jgi:hypothetical protein
MYIEIIPAIKTLLEETVLYTVNGEDITPTVYPHPLEEAETPESYPAIIFFPTNFDNKFSSTDSNFKQVNFSVIILINAENITNEQLFTFTLPTVADKVIEQLDQGWSFSRIGSKRVWARADVGTWGKSVEESGRYGFVNINLIIKLETTI